MPNPIITAALTGPVATKADNPGMPGTVAEIAADAKAAYDAGAAVIHIHLRDDDGHVAVVVAQVDVDDGRAGVVGGFGVRRDLGHGPGHSGIVGLRRHGAGERGGDDGIRHRGPPRRSSTSWLPCRAEPSWPRARRSGGRRAARGRLWPSPRSRAG